MGQIVKQDRAVSLDLMHAFLESLEKEWSAADRQGKIDVASIGAYAAFAFCGSFRGPEVFLVDLHGLIKYTQENFQVDGKDFIIVPLLGRFKNELGDQYHLIPSLRLRNRGSRSNFGLSIL
jgi:hypothetical protein